MFQMMQNFVQNGAFPSGQTKKGSDNHTQCYRCPPLKRLTTNLKCMFDECLFQIADAVACEALQL